MRVTTKAYVLIAALAAGVSSSQAQTPAKEKTAKSAKTAPAKGHHSREDRTGSSHQFLHPRSGRSRRCHGPHGPPAPRICPHPPP